MAAARRRRPARPKRGEAAVISTSSSSEPAEPQLASCPFAATRPDSARVVRIGHLFVLSSPCWRLTCLRSPHRPAVAPSCSARPPASSRAESTLAVFESPYGKRAAPPLAGRRRLCPPGPLSCCDSRRAGTCPVGEAAQKEEPCIATPKLLTWPGALRGFERRYPQLLLTLPANLHFSVCSARHALLWAGPARRAGGDAHRRSWAGRSAPLSGSGLSPKRFLRCDDARWSSRGPMVGQARTASVAPHAALPTCFRRARRQVCDLRSSPTRNAGLAAADAVRRGWPPGCSGGGGTRQLGVGQEPTATMSSSARHPPCPTAAPYHTRPFRRPPPCPGLLQRHL